MNGPSTQDPSTIERIRRARVVLKRIQNDTHNAIRYNAVIQYSNNNHQLFEALKNTYEAHVFNLNIDTLIHQLIRRLRRYLAFGNHSPIHVNHTDENLFQRYIQTYIMLHGRSPQQLFIKRSRLSDLKRPGESGRRNYAMSAYDGGLN